MRTRDLRWLLRSWIQLIALTVVVLGISASKLYAQNTSPVGLWQGLDETGKPKVLIRVSEQNQKLYGKIEKTLKSENPLCTKCEGDKKNQPLMGMTILWDLKKDGNEWSGGQILDPDTGKTYKCKLDVVEGGKKLKVRGYMGFALIGKTEYWIRAE